MLNELIEESITGFENAHKVFTRGTSREGKIPDLRKQLGIGPGLRRASVSEKPKLNLNDALKLNDQELDLFLKALSREDFEAFKAAAAEADAARNP